MVCIGNREIDVFNVSKGDEVGGKKSIFLFILDFISSLDLCLVIFCSSENEDRAHMAAALDQYRLATVPHTASPKEIRQYLKTQFKARPQKQGRFRDQNLFWTSAGTVDKER